MGFPMGYGTKVVLVLLGITLFSIGAQCAPIGSRRALVGEPVFDVTTYGAKGDGRADGALAFIKAWKEACAATGAVILRIPKGDFNVGKVVFNGPCTANPITIDLQGVLLQTKDPSALAGNEPAMLINQVTGVTLSGGGTVDGQGAAVWKYNDGKTLLPISLMFSKVKQCAVDGVNFLNAKGVHLKVTASEDVSISNVKVTAPDESPNTDGIVISNSNRVSVTNCNIGTGDDCVAIGDTNVGVNVSQVTCGPGHGLSVGSLGKRTNEGDVKDIRVWNCTCTGTTNGVRIKTYRASPILKATNIVFDDIIMNAVKNPVLIDQHYDSKNKNEPSNVHLSGVHFTNIRGTTISQAPVALNCSDAFPCDGVELNNIDLVPAPESKYKTVIAICANTKFALLGNSVNPAGCEAFDAAAAPVGQAVNNVTDSASAPASATSDAAVAAAEIAAQADQEVVHELADIDHF